MGGGVGANDAKWLCYNFDGVRSRSSPINRLGRLHKSDKTGVVHSHFHCRSTHSTSKPPIMAAAAAACRSSYRCVSTLARKCIVPAAATTTTTAPNSCSQLVQGPRRPSLWRPHGRRHFAAATARPQRQGAAEHTAAEPSSSRLLQLQQRLAHEGGVAAAKNSKPARRRAKVATPVAPHTVVDWRRLAQLGRQALTDGYGRFHNYLRISLTERCNLRCK